MEGLIVAGGKPPRVGGGILKNSISGRIDRTGAEVIVDPRELLGDQEKSLKRILLHVHDMAAQEVAVENELGSDYLARQMRRRPHHVFLIDGARGSGKTTLLATARWYLEYLGRPDVWIAGSENPEQKLLESYSRAIDRDLGISGTMPNRFYARHALRNGQLRATCFNLPILFPSDLEFGQSIMEGLIAQVTNAIEVEVQAYKDKKVPDTAGRIESGNHLLADIHRTVSAGWFLSRNTGHDAMLRDSMNYMDFLKKRGEANVASFSRVETWRQFVNRFLDYFASEFLVVFFDDTDVATAVSKDILHTIRIFLDHPRIATIIAGNLHSIRQSLVLDEMKNLGAPIGALTGEAEPTARDWRRYVRHEIEESLEKVLPRRFRFYIATAHNRSLNEVTKQAETNAQASANTNRAQEEPSSDEFTSHKEAVGDKIAQPEPIDQDLDFRRVFGTNFDKFCSQMQDLWRPEFLRARQRSHFRWLADRQEVWRETEANELESFLSWWLLRHSYADQLRPRTVRHMVALRAFTLLPDGKKSGLAVDNLLSEHKKRLAVILFESPENFEILHRFNDRDDRVLSWLHRQVIESSWRGDRFITINGRRIYENTYSYHFLFYRLDLGIAMPVQENPDDAFPFGLLPAPDGPNLTRHKAFFERNRRQRLYGVAAAIDHTTIPANCIYLNDIDCLPDAAWKPSDQNQFSAWGHRLLYDWPRIFFFDLPELRATDPLNTRNDPPQADTSTPEPNASNTRPGASPDSAPRVPEGTAREQEEQWVSNYFINTVMPVAALEVPQFARSPAHFGTTTRPFTDVARDSLLEAELSFPADPFFANTIRDIDVLRRRFDYLERLGTGPARDSIILQARDILQQWSRLVLDPAFHGNVIQAAAPTSPLSSRVGDIILELSSLIRSGATSAIASGQSGKTPTTSGDQLASFASHLISYQWLVNDVRRGWHAARIFLNQVSGPIKRQTSFKESFDEAENSAPEITRKDRFFRTDRYTIGTRHSLRRWMMRSNTLSEFVSGIVRNPLPDMGVEPRSDGFLELRSGYWSKKLREDLAYLAGIVSRDAPPPWAAPGADFGIDGTALKRILQARATAEDNAVMRKVFYFDPLHGAPGSGDPKSIEFSRTYSRLSRAYLLFIFGFSPALPALIHIEVAGILQGMLLSRDANSTRDAARKVLKDWQEEIERFLSFLHNYRRMLEVVKFRLDVMSLWEAAYGKNANSALRQIGVETKSGPASFGVWMTLTPDMSFATLGVGGIRLLPATFRFVGAELEGLQSEFEKRKARWDEVAGNNGRVVWRSILDDTYAHLIEALNFIRVTAFVIAENDEILK